MGAVKRAVKVPHKAREKSGQPAVVGEWAQLVYRVEVLLDLRPRRNRAVELLAPLHVRQGDTQRVECRVPLARAGRKEGICAGQIPGADLKCAGESFDGASLVHWNQSTLNLRKVALGEASQGGNHLLVLAAPYPDRPDAATDGRVDVGGIPPCPRPPLGPRPGRASVAGALRASPTRYGPARSLSPQSDSRTSLQPHRQLCVACGSFARSTHPLHRSFRVPKHTDGMVALLADDKSAETCTTWK